MKDESKDRKKEVRAQRDNESTNEDDDGSTNEDDDDEYIIHMKGKRVIGGL